MQLKLAIATLAVLALCSGARAENPAHIQQLLQTNDCPDCDLSGANLRGLDLTEANLAGANLQSAKLSQATLVRANLQAADLTNADFTGANFTGANLQKANLAGSGHDNFCRIVGNTEDSECLGITLFLTIGVELCDPTYDQTLLWELEALKELGDLCDPELGDNRWSYWQSYTSSVASSNITFLGANLTGANLSNTDLVGANFRYANLEQASFQGADLTYATMLQAGLDDGDIAANPALTNAFLTKADIQSAITVAIAEEKDRDRQNEGKVNNGRMNRTQQVHYLENNRFASTLQELGDWMPAETEHYRYAVVPQGDGTQSVVQTATAKVEGLRSLASVVFISTDELGDKISVAWVCETEEPSQVPPVLTPPASLEEAQCPAEARPVK